jgi:hypothetical protein
MNDEQILAAAEATGLTLFGLGMDKAKFEFCILAFGKYVGKIESFKEREACAKVAGQSFGVIGSTIAAAIRARGEA